MTKHLLSLCIGLTGLTCLTGGCETTPDEPQKSAVGLVEPRSFVERWEAQVPMRGDAIERMYVRDNLLFAYSDDNRVHVVDRNAGSIQRVDAPVGPNDRLFPPILTAEEILYPGHTTIEAFARQGVKRRSLNLDVSISSPAVEDKGRLFFGTDFARGGRIMEADTTRAYGYLGWQLMTGGGLSAAPVIHSSVLYFGGEDGRVYAVTVDRDHAWPLEQSSVQVNGRVIADLKIDDYAVYVPVETGMLYALDRSNGKVKWQYFAPRGLRHSPVATQTYVYQYVAGHGLVAIDKLQGDFTRKAKWTAADARQVVAVDNEFVYVRLKNNGVAALDKATGEKRFESKRHDFAVFATNTADSTIYAATKGGRLVAITPVLKPGVVGELVFDVLRDDPTAARGS